MTPKGKELQGRTGRPAPSSASLDEVLADASFPQDPYPVYARLRERVGPNGLPAAALAVGDADGEIRSEAFSAKGEVRTDSLFFLASVTKPIFATGFMQLVESGAIDLHAPIVRYIPEFANAPGKADVTSVHLLTHSSGVPDYPPDRIRSDRPSATAMTQHAIMDMDGAGETYGRALFKNPTFNVGATRMTGEGA